MEMGYMIVIGICIAAIGVLGLSIKVVFKNRDPLLKSVCALLFLFTMFRYVTLMVYGNAPQYGQMMALRYFYFASSIGLAIPTLSAIWYSVPLYREKIKYGSFIMLFSPWIIFYIYIIMRQPTVIVPGSQFGYVLELAHNHQFYFNIAQGSMILVTLLLAFVGILRYKNLQIRTQLIMIILAQMTLLLDGITCYVKVVHTFPVFTVSELFGFVAVCYAFSNRLLEVKGILNN